MKFTCSQTAVLKAINTCSKAIALRTTIPILKGVLITIKDGKATFTSSNLSMSIETSFDVQNSENGSTVVSAKLLADIIRKLPNTLISFTTDKEFGKFSISCMGSEFSLVQLSADEFPAISSLEASEIIEIEKNDLKDLINKTVFSASIDEKKGILTGCLLNLKKDCIEAISLDGFRMSVVRKSNGYETERSVVVPASILSEISKILSDDEETEKVMLKIEEKKAEFITADTKITSRLLDGNFVNYEDIIPKDNQIRVTVNREDMLCSVERASLFAKEGKNNLIKLSVFENSIEIESQSDEGMVKEKLDADVIGEGLVIGFNSKYILDVLKVLKDEEVVFVLGGNLSPCIIVPIEGNDYTFLILPVRISA